MRRLIVCTVLVLVAGACGGGDTAPPTDVSTSVSPTVSTSVTATEPSSNSIESTATSMISTTTSSSSTTTSTASVAQPPPKLVVTDPADGATVGERTYVFRGRTDPGCTVLAAGRYAATVDEQGAWSVPLVLNPGGNVASFVASAPDGQTTSVSIAVTYAVPIQLLDTGLGVASFGTDASVAMAALEAVLGPPSNDLDPLGEDIFRVARWDGYGLTVILVFDDGVETFAGWVHDSSGLPLYTIEGVTAGDTVGDIREAYGAEAGDVQHLDPTECGPEWSIIIGDPNVGRVIRAVLDGSEDTSSVVDLEAGTVFWC